MQSLATEERVVLIEGGRDARYVETGHLVYALEGVVTAMAFDVDAREVLGGPVPLVEGVRAANSSGAAEFSVARNGSLVYLPGAGRQWSLVALVADSYRRRDPDERTTQELRRYARLTRRHTASPLRFSTRTTSTCPIWRLDDGPLTRLTFNEADDRFPLWTPDSQRVVFTSGRDGGGLFWKAADGTGDVEQLLESTNTPRPWAWSTDGRLVFDQSPGDIGVLSVGGDRTVEMLLDTEFEEQTPALSPDGRWLAYRSDESGQGNIFVQPFPNVDDGKWQVSTSGGADPVWSVDGRRLFFVELPTRLMVAEVETAPTFSPGTPREAFSLPGIGRGGARRYDLVPDGERFRREKRRAGQRRGCIQWPDLRRELVRGTHSAGAGALKRVRHAKLEESALARVRSGIRGTTHVSSAQEISDDPSLPRLREASGGSVIGNEGDRWIQRARKVHEARFLDVVDLGK